VEEAGLVLSLFPGALIDFKYKDIECSFVGLTMLEKSLALCNRQWAVTTTGGAVFLAM
jgi:hypothetical protein